MSDVHHPSVRSYNMSQIKGANTKPEIMVRKFLFSHGFRYRINCKRIPGKPDIVLSKYKTVIFVHGCFWHGHDRCKYYVVPKTRTNWWVEKITQNKLHDEKIREILTKLGWRVIIVFECELKGEKKKDTFTNLVKSIMDPISTLSTTNC